MADCPVCGHDRTRLLLPSRRTGAVFGACRHCGVRWLHEHPERDRVSEKYDVGQDQFRIWNDSLAQETVDSAHGEVLARLREYLDGGGRALFDVGAGGGGFLAHARSEGFAPDGSDISPGAVEVARAKNGVEIRHGFLAELDSVPPQDAVTLWCVLAHVPDPEVLLTESRDLMRPGGVLFLQTPRSSFLDRVAAGLHRVSRGRWSRIMDRRIGLHHMVLHSVKSIRILLERGGFDVLDIKPQVRFSMQLHTYFESLGFSPRRAAMFARPFTELIERGLFPRNIIDAFARRAVTAEIIPFEPPVHRRRTGIAVAVASVALVGAGTSVAAAQNMLPVPMQRMVGETFNTVLPDRFALPYPPEPSVGSDAPPPPTPAEAPVDVGGDDTPASTGSTPPGSTNRSPDPALPEVPDPDRREVPDPDLPEPKVPDPALPEVPDPDLSVPKVPTIP